MSIKGYATTFLKRTRPTLLAGSAILCSMIVFATVVLSRKDTAPASTKPKVAKTTTAADSQQSRTTLVETEIITVTPRGFEPRTITRTQGRFILMIENATLENLNLRFSREAGESLNEIRASREQPDWNEIFDLTPGRYVLTELSHPQWTCLITITAR